MTLFAESVFAAVAAEWALNPKASVLVRRPYEDTEAQRDESHVAMEVEIGMMHLQAKRHQRLSEP